MSKRALLRGLPSTFFLPPSSFPAFQLCQISSLLTAASSRSAASAADSVSSRLQRRRVAVAESAFPNLAPLATSSG